MVTRRPSAPVTLDTDEADPPPRDEDEAKADEDEDTEPAELDRLEIRVAEPLVLIPWSARSRAASDALSLT